MRLHRQQPARRFNLVTSPFNTCIHLPGSHERNVTPLAALLSRDPYHDIDPHQHLQQKPTKVSVVPSAAAVEATPSAIRTVPAVGRKLSRRTPGHSCPVALPNIAS